MPNLIIANASAVGDVILPGPTWKTST